MYDIPPATLILWDEPENGLHSTRRFKLLDMLIHSERQVFLATHATEFAPVLDDECQVYQLSSRLQGKAIALSSAHVTGRRGGFQIAQALGINPATTLFTANVVLWVEGPSDMIFWRHWLAGTDLIEGFDYTFVMYGGSNIAHLEVAETAEPGVGIDLLALCRHPVVIIDSDRRNASDDLKAHASRVKEALGKLNREHPHAGFFLETAGRELENYLPLRAVRYAVETLFDYSEDQKQLLALESLEIGQYERYFESVEAHIKKSGLLGSTGKALGVSKWGNEAKVEFMIRALQMDGLLIDELRFDGAAQTRGVLDWMRKHRVDRKKR